MAKAKKDDVIIVNDNEPKKEDEVVLVSEETKAKLQQIKNEENEEVVIEKQEDKPVTKNVKIVLNKNHKCNVGGNWYSFTANKQYIVPENVKNILKGAGLLAPL